MTALRFRWLSWCIASVLATALSTPAWQPRPALAQSEVSSDERERLYEEIRSEAEALERHNNLLKKVIRAVQPAVVHIEAKKGDDGFGRRSEEAGSGVIIEFKNRYYVLTNRHVISNTLPSRIFIKLSDGRQLHPDQIWSDRATDVAVMSLGADSLLAARLGDSSQLEIGDFVVAVGSPFGLSHSVTFGIISAKGRRDLQLGADVQFQNFLQTDAAINPGNSGGPLINVRGEVIGINTAIASNSGGNEGIGFSIPINIVMLIAEQLIERGNVVRAFLGVLLDSEFDAEAAVRSGLPRQVGARVKGVTKESAAENAKLRVGDIILEFDGVRIENDDHLINQVNLTPIGKEVSILIFRNGAPLKVRATVEERK